MTIIKFIFKYIRKYFKLEIAAFAFTLFIALFRLLPPKLIGNSINYLSDKNFFSSTKLIIIAIIITITLSILDYFLSLLFIYIRNNLVLELRRDIFDAALYGDNISVESEVGKINTKIMLDVNNISKLFSVDIISLLVDITTVLIVMSVLFMINTKITLVIMLEIIPLVLVFKCFFPRIYKNSKVMQDKLDQIFNGMSRCIKGLQTIKLLSIEHIISKKMFNSFQQAKEKNIKLSILSACLNDIFVIFTVFSMVIIWIVGGYEVVNQRLSIGELITIQMYLTMLTAPVSKILRLNMVFSTAFVSIQRVVDFLQRGKIIDVETRNMEQIKSIKIESLSFFYSETKIFQDVSIDFRANSLDAVVGRSGIGKSTLAYLLVRVLEPKSGQIILNQTSIQEYPITQLRNAVCLLESNTVLLGKCLREILLLPGDNSLDQEAISILKDLGLENFAENLLNRYPERDLGINGAKLSEGQKHRLAITRALLRKPKFLIIDEALYALDIFIESKTIATLSKYKKQMGIVLITHSLNFIDNFDRVIVLQKQKDTLLPHIMHKPKREDVVVRLLEN